MIQRPRNKAEMLAGAADRLTEPVTPDSEEALLARLAMDDDDNLSPIARACIANARRALAAANASLVPDRRPFVPPTPETPAERVQGEAGEVAE